MTSPLLALFVRSLREESRLQFTYFSRAALVLLILLFLIATRTSMGWMNAPGLEFFDQVAHINLCFVVLAGVSYFSSAISEEKEEMTLGLLRMTDLNPLSILLGKSTSRLCVAMLLFAAQIPFTLLAIPMGGIALRQLVATYLSIGTFIIFVCNLALLASVICRRTTGAAILTGATMTVFFASSPLARWFAQLPIWLGWLPRQNGWTRSLLALAELANSVSPFPRVESVLATRPFGRMLGLQVWSNLAFGLACFLVAWLVFEIFCGEQKESGPSRIGLARVHRRHWLRSPGRPWRRALAWKDFYFTTGGKLWVAIKLLIYGAPLVIRLCWPQKLGGPPRADDFGVGTFWFMIVALGVELSFAAAAIFRNERQGQTLSSLAMLPQGIRRVAYEKLLGVVPALTAAGVYLIVSLPLVVTPFANFLKEIHESRVASEALGGIAFAVAQGVFFLHLVVMLSLYIKRGALPLALGIEFLLYILTVMTVIQFPQAGAGCMNVLIALTLFATVVLHVGIGRRLETVAGEG